VPNELINNTAMVAQNFFLEVDGDVLTALTGVSGLDVEVQVTTYQQATKGGKMVIGKTLANQTSAPDITLTRIAPNDAKSDKIWTWFNDVRDKGTIATARKNGAVVIYDAANTEVARFSFFNAWPSKISTDSLSADSNDAVKENITLACERLERVK
jgi:phage tail-like protein